MHPRAIENAENPWRPLLRSALHGRPYPIVVAGERVTPGASLWSGTRRWVEAFRGAGLKPGDRVVHAVEPGPGGLMVLAACLWEGLTVAMASPESPLDSQADALLQTFDARAVIGNGDGVWKTLGAGLPQDAPPVLRESELPRSMSTRFILSTSGTGGKPRHVALSDDNVLSVLESHGPLLEPCAGWTSAVALSALPWHHAFGLVIDLLPMVFGGAMVVRDASGGRDPESTLALAEQWGVNHMSMVPLQADRLFASERGAGLLEGLLGGVVGGAAVSAALAGRLVRTRLRVGYGQTEASPGICLGTPGEWSAGWLGRAVGCETRVDGRGRLLVKGRNVCAGVWGETGVVPASDSRWLDTGDLVEPESGGFRFIGRSDDTFKLSNGRLVDAPRIERAIASAGTGESAVLLPSCRGASIDVVLIGTGLKVGPVWPDSDAVRDALGSLCSRVGRVVGLGPDDVPRTRKGSVDRRALAERLAGASSASAEKERIHDDDLGPTVRCLPAPRIWGNAA